MDHKFEIWMKYFNRGGSLVDTETLVQTVPAEENDLLRFVNPIVKNEMGQVEGFDFSIEKGTPFYDAFKQMRTFIRVTYCGTTIFYGRVLTIDNNRFTGTRKVRCEGPLAFLMDSPVEGVEETKRTVKSTYDYLSELISNHNNYVRMDIRDYGDAKVFRLGELPEHYSGSVSASQQIGGESRKYGADSWTDTKSAIEDLRSHYGGYLRARPAGRIGDGIYLDWMNHYFNSSENEQTIEVGKNILDINDVTEIENIFTAIIPIGKTNVTVTSSETNAESTKQANLYIDGRILKVPDIVSVYGDSLNSGYHTREEYEQAINRYGMIVKTVSFQDVDNKDKLLERAREWIKNNYQGEVTKFTIKAVDMKQIGENTDPIMVGDRVRIIYPVWVEDNTAENGRVEIKRDTVLTCLSVSYDLYHPENNNYTFGIPANILTKTYGVAKKNKSVAQQATTTTTEPAKGGGTSKTTWLNACANWLINHKFHWYSTNKPWKYEWDNVPTNRDEYNKMSGDWLYRNGQWLVKAERVTTQPGDDDEGEQFYWRATKGTEYKKLSYDAIEKYRIIEYVYAVYKINLYTFFPGLKPDKMYVSLDDAITIPTFDWSNPEKIVEQAQIKIYAATGSSLNPSDPNYNPGAIKAVRYDSNTDKLVTTSSWDAVKGRTQFVDQIVKKNILVDEDATDIDPNSAAMTVVKNMVVGSKNNPLSGVTLDVAKSVLIGRDSSTTSVPSNVNLSVADKVRVGGDLTKSFLADVNLDVANKAVVGPVTNIPSDTNLAVSGKSVVGQDDNDEWKITINDTVEYQAADGGTFNNDAFITCRDIHFPNEDGYVEYKGIRSRLAIFDTVIADDVLAKNITAKQVNADIFKTHDIFSEDIVTDRNIWVDNIFAKSIDMGANGEILSNNYMYAVPGMSKLNILASIYASYRFTEISGGKIQMQGKKFNDQSGDWKDLANFNIAATAKYKTDVAAAHNEGGGTAYCSPGSASIDPGQTHTLHVYYENSNGVPVWTGRSYTVTAKDAPAPTHSIDIPNSGIDTYDWEPTGTKLKNLRDAIKSAISEKKWLKFVVDCGSGSKTYKMDFT